MPEQSEQTFGPESESVSAHLSIVQGIIGRMGANSTSCKIQCVVLVAGIIVLVAQTKTPGYTLLSLIPTGLFLYLDIYYLALEKTFRNSYDAFVCKLHRDQIFLKDLYVVRPDSQADRKHLVPQLKSKSIWPFYGALTITIALVWKFGCIRTSLGF